MYSVIHFCFTFALKAYMISLKIFGRELQSVALRSRLKVAQTFKYTNFNVYDKNRKRIKKPHKPPSINNILIRIVIILIFLHRNDTTQNSIPGICDK